MAHRSALRKDRNRARQARDVPPVVFWLRAGAVAAGLGAAVAVGAGVASAEDGGRADASPGPANSTASTGHKAATAKGTVAGARRPAVKSDRTPSAVAATAPSVQPLPTARLSVRAPVAPSRIARSARAAAPTAAVSAPTVAVASSSTPAAAPAPTEPVYPAALTSPVNLESISVDVRRWFGLRPLPKSPFNFRPLPRPISDAWIALRHIEYRFFNDYPTASPTQSPSDALSGLVNGRLNGVDPDGDRLAYTVVDQPDNGSVVINADGSYTYTPERDFSHTGGADEFSVVVGDTPGNPWHLHGLADLLGLSQPKTVAVSVTVDPIDNRAPDVLATVTAPDPDEDGVVTGSFSATDQNGDPVSYRIATDPGKGTASIAPDGTYTYTPDSTKRHAAAANTATADDKADTFVIETSDGYGGVSQTTVGVKIRPSNTQPDVGVSKTLFGTPTILLSDDGAGNTSSVYTDVFLFTPQATDADGDTVSITVTNRNPSAGTLIAQPDGTYLYVPSGFKRYSNGMYVLAPDGDINQDAQGRVTVEFDDGHGGGSVTAFAFPVTYLGSMTAVYTPAGSVAGSGNTYIDATGNSIVLTGVLTIEQTPLQLAFDNTSGNVVISQGLTIDQSGQLVIPSQTTADTPVIQVTGCIPDSGGSCTNNANWNVVTVKDPNGKPTQVNTYLQGRLATSVNLGDANTPAGG